MVGVNTKFWWYASRASGLVLWLVLAASICWGLAITARMIRRKGMAAWMLDLHRHLGTLGLVFTGVHLLSLWADNFVHFGPKELFIPMASGWRPGAVTWGIVAFYLLVIVQVSSWCMKRIPRRVWHALHLLSLPLFVTGSAHAILAGADWTNRVVQWGLIIISTSVVWLGTFRLLAPTKNPMTDRLAAAKAASAATKLQRGPGEGSVTVAVANQHGGAVGSDVATRALVGDAAEVGRIARR